MDAIYKTFRAEIREVGENDGLIDLMIPISSDKMDRDGEIIEPTAFKKSIPQFMKHPVLVASHDYHDLTNQIGEWTKLKVEGDGVSGKPKYYVNAGNEQADWAFYLASKGVAAFSVGFIPKVWEDGKDEKSPRRTYKEVELLEISQVIIPSNRQAVQSMRSKSVDPVVLELCDEVEKELVTKPEETDDFIRIPVRECEVTATIDIAEKEGISALYCGKEKLVRTYLFRKDKGWDMARAKAWVKEHEGKAFESEEGVEIDHQPKPVSQKEIMDEIDYLKVLIAKVGLCAEAAESLGEIKQDMSQMRKMHDMMADCEEMAGKAKAMSEEMMGDKADMADMDKMRRMHDMMADCEEKAGKAKKMSEGMMDEEEMDDEKTLAQKAGAVLNKKNKDRLNQIKGLAQEVLDSAGAEEEEEKRFPGYDNARLEKDNITIADVMQTIQEIRF